MQNDTKVRPFPLFVNKFSKAQFSQKMSFYASSTRYPVTFRPADREPSKFGPSVTHDGFYYYDPYIMFEPRLFDEQDGDSLGLDPNESAQLNLYWNSTAEGLYYLDSGKL